MTRGAAVRRARPPGHAVLVTGARDGRDEPGAHAVGCRGDRTRRDVRRRTACLGARPRGLVVVAVDVQDPGNLGAIVRAAEAAGATGVIASGASADPFGWKALRGAMGSTFRLPVLRVPDVDDGAARLPRARLAHHRHRARRDAGHRVPLDEACAVLLGAEGTGLPQALVDAADTRLTIPMQAPVESLNVAVAAGIILYEARRQRGRR